VVGDPGNGLNNSPDAGEEQAKLDARKANPIVSPLMMFYLTADSAVYFVVYFQNLSGFTHK
jgi:hypothetical protein